MQYQTNCLVRCICSFASELGHLGNCYSKLPIAAEQQACKCQHIASPTQRSCIHVIAYWQKFPLSLDIGMLNHASCRTSGKRVSPSRRLEGPGTWWYITTSPTRARKISITAGRLMAPEYRPTPDSFFAADTNCVFS